MGTRWLAWTLTLACLGGLMKADRIADEDHVLSDHTRSGSSTVSSGELSANLMGLEEENDAAPELTGTINNQAKGKIWDVKIWFEDKEGNPIQGDDGKGPISGLRSGPSESLHATDQASLVDNSNGISTFNLAGGINAQGSHFYEAQVDTFAEPNNYKIKMAFSSKKSSSSKHYEALGQHDWSFADSSRTISGLAPTVREGVLLIMRNADAAKTLKGFAITLASNDDLLRFSGGEVRTTTDPDEPVSGVSLTVSIDGRTLEISGLLLAEGASAGIWLDLNHAYSATTSFSLTARY